MTAENIPDDNFVLVMTPRDEDMEDGKTGQHLVHFAYHKLNGGFGISKLPHRYYQLVRAMNKQRDPKYLFTAHEAHHIYKYIAKHNVRQNKHYQGVEQSKLGHIPTVKEYQEGQAKALKDLKIFRKKFHANKAKGFQHPFKYTANQMRKLHATKAIKQKHIKINQTKSRTRNNPTIQ